MAKKEEPVIAPVVPDPAPVEPVKTEPVAAAPVNLIEPTTKHKKPAKPKPEETDDDGPDFSEVMDHIDNKFNEFTESLKAKPTEKAIKEEFLLGGPLKDDYLDTEGWF